MAAIRLTATPSAIKPTPMASDQPLALGGSDERTESSRRNHPKRATTKPKPIMAMPVRIHASSVRSAAKRTRGSPAEGQGI